MVKCGGPCMRCRRKRMWGKLEIDKEMGKEVKILKFDNFLNFQRVDF